MADLPLIARPPRRHAGGLHPDPNASAFRQARSAAFAEPPPGAPSTGAGRVPPAAAS